MTEKNNISPEGGIHGELTRNRTFKANPRTPVSWNAFGDATITRVIAFASRLPQPRGMAPSHLH